MELKQTPLNKFKKFIDEIRPEDRVAVIYDTDMDGISSGIITVRALKKLGKNVVLFKTRDPDSRTITDDLVNELKENKITKIIFTDLAVEGFEGNEKLKEFEVMILDHHNRKKTVNNDLLSIKSFDLQDELEGHQYCAAKLVYDLFSQVIDISELDWLALAGVIGDMTYGSHKKWADEILTKYNLEIKENPFDTKIGELVQYITFASAIGTQEEFDKLSDAFFKAKNYEEVLKTLDYLNPVKKEYERLIKEFERKKEEAGDEVIFYKINSPYYFNSPVCSRLSNQYYPTKTIICMQEKNGRLNISARRQDRKYDLGKMLSEITSKLENAFGGGHPVASGAKIEIKDLNRFKEEVINWVKNNE